MTVLKAFLIIKEPFETFHKVSKGSLIMVLKNFLNDGTKKNYLVM